MSDPKFSKLPAGKPIVHPEIEDFDLLNALGSGSYSTVYRARHKKTREYVAVKTVAKSGLSKSSTDNLLLEIKLLKTLKHKYIVEMVDFMWDDKNIYILLELCAAGDLSAYIRQHQRLPQSTCRFFLRQLAIALRYMRAHNVSHFDLKPSNLLLTHTPALTLKVADFGFAQHLGLAETNTQLKGSPLYMAPEILLQRRYDPSADLWSIGCILYECLFGAAPYRSRNLAELMQKVQSRQAIAIPAGLLASCEHLLKRLLQHDPQARISFDEFFAHEFLDIDHEPTDANYTRSVQLFTRAVELDGAGRLEEACASYCEGLQYLVPLIAGEQCPQKQKQLRHNAEAYLRRAEEIRGSSGNGSSCPDSDPPTRRVATVCAVPPARASNSAAQRVQRALQPARKFRELHALSVSSPNIRDGLDIGRQAELFMLERNYVAAIGEFRGALGLLVPALAAEPRGDRRERLHRQVSEWMHEAEQVKVLLAAREQLAGAEVEVGREVAAGVGDGCGSEVSGAEGVEGSAPAGTSYAQNCSVQ